jgi:hypothetical protein
VCRTRWAIERDYDRERGVQNKRGDRERQREYEREGVQNKRGGRHSSDAYKT